jgi:hypothetical protein
MSTPSSDLTLMPHELIRDMSPPSRTHRVLEEYETTGKPQNLGIKFNFLAFFAENTSRDKKGRGEGGERREEKDC